MKEFRDGRYFRPLPHPREAPKMSILNRAKIEDLDLRILGNLGENKLKANTTV